MKCDKCGYVLQAFEDSCPRCAHLAAANCARCGRQGVAGVCPQCHKEMCAACLPNKDGLCLHCAPEQYATQQSPEETLPQRELHARESATPEAQSPAMHNPDAMGPAGAAAPMMRGVSHSTGFFDSIGRAFTFIGQSMGMVFRDKDLILPSLFAFLANAGIITAILLVAHFTGNMEALLADDSERGFNLGRLIFFAAVAFVSYVITYFFMGMTVNLVHARLCGRDAKLGEAFADALNNAGALVTLAVVSTAVAIVTSAMRSRRGRGLGDLAASAIERGWLVVTYLLVPIIILEDISFKESIDRGKRLHGGNFVPIAVGEIAVVVVNRIIIGVVVAIFAILGFYFYFNGQMGLFVPTVIVGIGVFIATLCFTEFVRTAYYTCLYLWAAERESVGEAARVPAPLAAATAH